MEKGSNRLDFLDVVKGVCVISICITHFHWRQEERLLLGFPFGIDMAVPIFMMISGYVNANSFEHHKIFTFRQAYNIISVARKCFRFMIPFTIAFVIETVISQILYPSNALSFTIISSYISGGGGPGSYYFPVMIQFILCFPLIYFVIRKSPKWGLVICFLANALWELVQHMIDLNPSIYRLLFFRYIFLVACGCFMYCYASDIKLSYALTISAIGFVFIILNQYCGYQTRILNADWSGTSFLAALWIFPVFYGLCRRLQNVSCRPLEILGKASFDIFLAQKLYYYFMPGRLIWLRELPTLVECFVSVAVCIILGMILYYLETPITQFCMRSISQTASYNDRRHR